MVFKKDHGVLEFTSSNHRPVTYSVLDLGQVLKPFGSYSWFSKMGNKNIVVADILERIRHKMAKCLAGRSFWDSNHHYCMHNYISLLLLCNKYQHDHSV